MANMSYCRYRNTLEDLKDCRDNMDDSDLLSYDEARARRRLILICAEIAHDYLEELDRPLPSRKEWDELSLGNR